MDIMPHHIEEKAWEEVYEETLQLIQSYPFMDDYVDEETYDCKWTSGQSIG
ncbi:hypothetical protein [Lederbergia ruris]|uniref:Uncharacterized protein n=1 Tax=Lederbergia ruris TaxID=217495 RepID=A0ABQ4KGX1_9BACI|nr:hypothetical protein [Lederbergia ruris]GIN57218.1 hypothetical protein J8TS2_15370 [Lederbergia ruris]